MQPLYWVGLIVVAAAVFLGSFWWFLQGSDNKHLPVASEACELVFSGEGLSLAPIWVQSGALYPDLPIPKRDGLVFAGWYDTPQGANSLDVGERLNMSREVTCDGDSVDVYPAWVTEERNLTEGTQVPILMYHWFTTKPGGETESPYPNLYLDPTDFDAHLTYIIEEDFYLPSWTELSAFIDGDLYLPARTVVLTVDDGHESWYELAVPLVEKHQVLVTSFVIGRDGIGPEVTQYVLKRSHTNKMHELDGGAYGRMVRWSEQEIIQDMDQSAEMLGGVRDVMAYPFGQHNDTAHAALTAGGWKLARTTQPGYVTIGTEKLELPIVPVDYGMSVENLAVAIG